MDRHDRRDHDRHHHRKSRHSEEKISLQELKERARREVDHGRPNRGNDQYHRYRDDRDTRRRRSQSRSCSPDRHRNRHDRNRDFASRGRRDQGEFRQERRQENDKSDFQPRRNDNYGDPNASGSHDSANGKDGNAEEKPVEIKPNFELTGNLAKDTNMFNGVLVKYHEPAEAKKPKKHWRFYPFKGDTPLDFIPLHRQSAYLFGRDRKVADIPVDHPSCSKQHAVVQFRSVEVERSDGTKGRATRPYIIDLESANGTYVNNKQIEAKRYVELLERDVVKFGFSSREYVMLHDQSQNDQQAESDTEP